MPGLLQPSPATRRGLREKDGSIEGSREESGREGIGIEGRKEGGQQGRGAGGFGVRHAEGD